MKILNVHIVEVKKNYRFTLLINEKFVITDGKDYPSRFDAMLNASKLLDELNKYTIFNTFEEIKRYECE